MMIDRSSYRELSESEKQSIQDIKTKGADLYDYISSLGTSRETSLAKTKIEEAVMWAVKAISG